MVRSIQSGVQQASQGMEGAVELVNGGVTAVGRANEVIVSIREDAEAISEATAGIANALKEQNAASNDIGRDVSRIAQLSERTNDAARESSGIADQLQGMADAMSAAISRFRAD